MNETTETTATATTPRKWGCCPTNPPGKIQLGRVNKALANLRAEHHTSISKSGIFGKTDGYDRESCYSTVRFQVCGDNPERADVRAEQDRIGAKFEYLASKDNAGAIVVEIEAALVKLEAGRAVEAVDVPEAIGATRTRYGQGGAITRGHWEIQFKSGGRIEGEALSVFAGYFDTPDPQASAEADAAAESRAAGGALGTVKRNLEHDGVEIAFSEKPSDSLRDSLKRAGFRITRRPPWKWYQKYSVAAWEKACTLAGVATTAPTENPDPAGAYVQAQENAFLDSQAAACGA